MIFALKLTLLESSVTLLSYVIHFAQAVISCSRNSSISYKERWSRFFCVNSCGTQTIVGSLFRLEQSDNGYLIF